MTVFKDSPILKGHTVGFALYDVDQKLSLCEYNADKYFTAASNTKLFSFYIGLKILKDSIPGLRYVEREDSLIFWGTGDPSLLHPILEGSNVLDLLRVAPQKLYYAAGNYTGKFYGHGWMYEDYNTGFQPEKSELPLFGNVVNVFTNSAGELQITPVYFKKYIQKDETYTPFRFKIERKIFTNEFTYPSALFPPNFKQQIPWRTTPELTTALLEEQLGKTVSIISMPLPSDANTIYSVKSDSLYKEILQKSDNFLAEQLLIVCASTRFDTLSTENIISYANQEFLQDLPDPTLWFDGSGISRYNLFTPRTLVALLGRIKEEMKDQERLYGLFPAGGISGTIKKLYPTDGDNAFVWAKTGTVKNNYNQSGYLLTKKGKNLIFSFMNNNYSRPSSEVRKEVARIITYIHKNF
ncbi:MAG: D-alanyl-D-alanine carboxypeptidase [Flavobacteriales bacterium]